MFWMKLRLACLQAIGSERNRKPRHYGGVDKCAP